MRRSIVTTVSCCAAVFWLGLTPGFSGQRNHPHPPPAQAHAQSPTHPTPPAHPRPATHPSKPESKTTPAPKPTSPPQKPAPFVERVEHNPQLASRLQALLPSGMTLASAAEGFRNEGQFIAALHVSHNLDIPFAQLKAEMTGRDHDSLGQAIHELRPSANVKAAVKTAHQEAKADLKATRPTKPVSDRDKDDR